MNDSSQADIGRPKTLNPNSIYIFSYNIFILHQFDNKYAAKVVIIRWTWNGDTVYVKILHKILKVCLLYTSFCFSFKIFYVNIEVGPLHVS